MRDANGRQRKIIIFTERRDTLDYLAVKIRGLMGNDESVVMIHGAVHARGSAQSCRSYCNDPDVRVLLATDAAGEGVDLQNANLMVNYDLPVIQPTRRALWTYPPYRPAGLPPVEHRSGRNARR